MPSTIRLISGTEEELIKFPKQSKEGRTTPFLYFYRLSYEYLAADPSHGLIEVSFCKDRAPTERSYQYIVHPIYFEMKFVDAQSRAAAEKYLLDSNPHFALNTNRAVRPPEGENTIFKLTVCYPVYQELLNNVLADLAQKFEFPPELTELIDRHTVATDLWSLPKTLVHNIEVAIMNSNIAAITDICRQHIASCKDQKSITNAYMQLYDLVLRLTFSQGAAPTVIYTLFEIVLNHVKEDGYGNFDVDIIDYTVKKDCIKQMGDVAAQVLKANINDGEKSIWRQKLMQTAMYQALTAGGGEQRNLIMQIIHEMLEMSNFDEFTACTSSAINDDSSKNFNVYFDKNNIDFIKRILMGLLRINSNFPIQAEYHEIANYLQERKDLALRDTNTIPKHLSVGYQEIHNISDKHIYDIKCGGKLIHTLGLARTYMGRVERGEQNISIQNLINIAITLKVEVGSLIPPISSLKRRIVRG